jgi:putative transposase
VGNYREYAAGAKVSELCRKHGMSDVTFYKWKAKHGGLQVSDVRRLKDLEEENSKLKKLLAEQMLPSRVCFAYPAGQWITPG